MDLSIIVLNYNGRIWLENLLPSLQAHYLALTKREVEVVVIDNASTDDSLVYLNQLQGIRLLTSPQNLGFAAGNNLALSTIQSRYVLLLNSDTECMPTLSNFDVLLDWMDANPLVGIATPKVLLQENKLDLACHRGEPTLWAAFTYFSGLEKLMGKSSLFGQYHLTNRLQDSIHEIDACSGAAMMVRTDAMRKVGLLDERFFMYAEDLDWCKRFQERGFKVVYFPIISILHHKYKSGFDNQSLTTRRTTKKWFYSTMLQYYDKHYSDKYPKLMRWLLKLFVRLKAS